MAFLGTSYAYDQFVHLFCNPRDYGMVSEVIRLKTSYVKTRVIVSNLECTIFLFELSFGFKLSFEFKLSFGLQTVSLRIPVSKLNSLQTSWKCSALPLRFISISFPTSSRPGLESSIISISSRTISKYFPRFQSL